MESSVLSSWGGVGVEGSRPSHPEAECPSRALPERRPKCISRLRPRISKCLALDSVQAHADTPRKPPKRVWAPPSPQGAGPSLDITALLSLTPRPAHQPALQTPSTYPGLPVVQPHHRGLHLRVPPPWSPSFCPWLPPSFCPGASTASLSVKSGLLRGPQVLQKLVPGTTSHSAPSLASRSLRAKNGFYTYISRWGGGSKGEQYL